MSTGNDKNNIMQADISPEKVFRELADTLANSNKANFFEVLIERLESILDVDHVILTEIVNAGSDARTIGVRSQGQTLENFTYALEQTPCGLVGVDEPYFYNTGVQERFPEDSLLQTLGAESYMGMSIASPTGERVGTLCILQNSPMTWADIGREVLRITVAQIGAEMERYKNEQRIAELAFQDRLTGLPNRARLQDYLHEVVANSHAAQRAIGLVIVDLKRFKEINDTHGHHAGDKLLVAVAGRLKRLVGPHVFVARQASDEYAIVDTNASQSRMRTLVEQIQEMFTEPFGFSQSQFIIDINIGAALFPHDSDTAAELFQHASIALDEAKREGLGHCIYDASMAEKLYRKHRILSRLSKAIHDNLLEVHLQPQFCINTGKLYGAEALCRWTDKELGVVSPVEFIPLAEERGLIQELDAFVLRSVSEQLLQWRSRSMEFPGRMSVNLSAQQFESADVVGKLRELTKVVGSDAFVLELTEGVMMRKPEQALVVTQTLRRNGFEIAVDDFGTGYSSLAYLQRLAIQLVKIDRSFISNIEDNAQNRSIVSAIIAMAHSMGMTTIAEGVETESQMALLKELGCDYLQGFYLGRPVSATDFEQAWLTEKAR